MIPNTEPSIRLNRPRFGSLSVAPSAAVLDPVTANVERFFSQVIAPNRTQEMLVEDLLGFGGLRTVMDLMRNRIFGGQNQDRLDLASARERLMREILSILTDNVASGVLAYGLGHVLDKKLNSFSNQFPSFPTVEAFQALMQDAPNEKAFLSRLAQQLAPADPNKAQAVTQLLMNLRAIGWHNLTSSKAMLKPAEQKAWASAPRQLAKALGQTSYQVSVNGERFYLPSLLKDTAGFLSHVNNRLGRQNGLSSTATEKALESAVHASSQWASVARTALKQTTAVKYAKLGALSAGFLLTFAVPYWIRAVTRKLDKEDTYPGERGVQPRFAANAGPSNLAAHRVFSTFSAASSQARQNAKPGRMEQWFPYLTRSLNRGNTVPLTLSTIPLLFTFGLFDTVGRRFVSPFKPGFLKYLRNAYDFGKGFPFTTQQQMASMYAFLIASRLTSARSGNEFRERMVDSFLGWSLWILGTPFIKRAVSQMIDRNQGTHLIDKATGNLRTRAEVQELIRDGGKTLSRHVWIGALSTVATILMLGVIEPYIAILWTKRNVQRQQQKAAFQTGLTPN